jgi:hypothetical protein
MAAKKSLEAMRLRFTRNWKAYASKERDISESIADAGLLGSKGLKVF